MVKYFFISFFFYLAISAHAQIIEIPDYEELTRTSILEGFDKIKSFDFQQDSSNNERKLYSRTFNSYRNEITELDNGEFDVVKIVDETLDVQKIWHVKIDDSSSYVVFENISLEWHQMEVESLIDRRGYKKFESRVIGDKIRTPFLNDDNIAIVENYKFEKYKTDRYKRKKVNKKTYRISFYQRKHLELANKHLVESSRQE